MALSQSIDDAREERIGRHGVTARAFADALARTGEALAVIRARHADGKLPLLRLPEKTDDLAGIEAAAQRLVAGANGLAPHIVFLGTGGSSLGGQTVVQLAGCGVPASARYAPVRACISWTISTPGPTPRCSRSYRSR
jgi:glucose-6-phosphate isomerase